MPLAQKVNTRAPLTPHLGTMQGERRAGIGDQLGVESPLLASGFNIVSHDLPPFPALFWLQNPGARACVHAHTPPPTPPPPPTPRPGPTQFFLLGPFWLSFPFPGGHYSIARQASPWPGSKPLPQWLTALPRVMALPLGGHRFQLPPLGRSAPGITFRLQLHLSSTFAFFSLCAFRPLLTLAS